MNTKRSFILMMVVLVSVMVLALVGNFVSAEMIGDECAATCQTTNPNSVIDDTPFSVNPDFTSDEFSSTKWGDPDGDSVPNFADNCPTIYGLVEMDGCPSGF